MEACGYDNQSLSLALGKARYYITNALSGRKNVRESVLNDMAKLLRVPKSVLIEEVVPNNTGRAKKKSISPVTDSTSTESDLVADAIEENEEVEEKTVKLTLSESNYYDLINIPSLLGMTPDQFVNDLYEREFARIKKMLKECYESANKEET
jgi:hypothetical protein